MWQQALIVSFAVACLFILVESQRRCGRKKREKRAAAMFVAMGLNVMFLASIDPFLQDHDTWRIVSLIEYVGLAGILLLCLPPRWLRTLSRVLTRILDKGFLGRYKRKQRQLWLWSRYREID